MFVCASLVSPVLRDAQRGHPIPWSYRQLRAAMWVLGLNHRAISLAPATIFSALPTMGWDYGHVSLHLAYKLISLWMWGAFHFILKGG